MATSEKDLDTLVAAVAKSHGKGALQFLGAAPVEGIEVVPTGSMELDKALGVGGYPRGRIIEIYGPEASGKTTLALHAIAECQKAGGQAAFIDAEHALDTYYANCLGIDVNRLLINQPDHGEQALQIVEAMVRSNLLDIIVIDSVSALVPKAELDGEIGDSHVGLQARLMGQALRKLTPIVSKSNTVVIFINQLRLKIGVMFGNPETTSGGNALKFYASQRIDIRKIGTIKKGEEAVGSRVRIKVVKNKVAPPFSKCETEILFGVGVHLAAEALDTAVAMTIVPKSGAWYYLWPDEPEKKLQGREKALEYLRDNPEELDKLVKQIQK